MLKRLVLIVAALALTVALPELWSAGQLRAEDGAIVTASDAVKAATAASKIATPQKSNGPKPLYVNVDHGYPLELTTPAASVFIANPDIADVQVMSPTSIMIFGKRTGDTTFMATDAGGITLENRTIRVVQDLSNLRREINNIIPGNKVRVESVPNGMVLAGTARDAATIADVYKLAQRYLPASGGDIINRIRVGGSNQVQIRVRFAEVARNIDSSLGFNWQSIGQMSGFTFGIATGAAALAGASSVISTRPNNTALSLPNDVIGVSRRFGDKLTVDGLIDALAQDGLVTILAEPNLTAMSGETANFLAGGEFPVPIPQGNGTISISFKSYGISLAFTPTLIGENRINLHVKPEVSQLTTTGSIVQSNITVPAISTRRAETTVEVASGQSFAIAGLLDNNQTQTINKYPLLGDLPIIGTLFRSTRFQNGQSELVIIITPYIVRPTGEKLALPMDGFSPPSEEERLLDMRYSSGNPDMRPMSGEPIAVREAPQPAAAAAVPATVAPVASQPATKAPRDSTKPKRPPTKNPPLEKPSGGTSSPTTTAPSSVTPLSEIPKNARTEEITTKAAPPQAMTAPPSGEATARELARPPQEEPSIVKKEATPPTSAPPSPELQPSASSGSEPSKPVGSPPVLPSSPTPSYASPPVQESTPVDASASQAASVKQEHAKAESAPPALKHTPKKKPNPHSEKSAQTKAPAATTKTQDRPAATGGFILE